MTDRTAATGAAGNERAPARPGDYTRRTETPRIGLRTLTVMAVVTVVVGAGAGYLASLAMPDVWGARSEVFIRVEPFGTLTPERQLETQVVVAEGRTVLSAVAGEFGMTVEDLQRDFDARLLGDSEVIEFAYEDADPDRARAVGAAIVDSYLQVVNEAEPDAAQAVLESRAGETETALSETVARIEALGEAAPDGALEQLQAEQRRLEAELSLILDRILELELNTLSDARASLLTPTYVLRDPVSPKPLQMSALGGLAGALVAGALVFGVMQVRSGP